MNKKIFFIMSNISEKLSLNKKKEKESIYLPNSLDNF